MHQARQLKAEQEELMADAAALAQKIALSHARDDKEGFFLHLGMMWALTAKIYHKNQEVEDAEKLRHLRVVEDDMWPGWGGIGG